VEGNSPNGTGAAAALLSMRRQKLKTSLGIEITVRAVGVREIALANGALVDVAQLGAAQRAVAEASGDGSKPSRSLLEAMKDPKTQEFFSVVEKVVRVGCVDPVFGTEAAAGPVVSDLPLADQLEAFHAILALSKFTQKAGEEIRP
jgi:hypothetical protein